MWKQAGKKNLDTKEEREEAGKRGVIQARW